LRTVYTATARQRRLRRLRSRSRAASGRAVARQRVADQVRPTAFTTRSGSPASPKTTPRCRRIGEHARLGQRAGMSPERPGYSAAVAVSTGEARSLALSLPEAVELDHHGRPSFRVGGKIFATLWDERRMNVMLDEGGILTAVESKPDACEKVWWGKRLAAVGVTLPCADSEFLMELLADAWEQRAPKRLISG